MIVPMQGLGNDQCEAGYDAIRAAAMSARRLSEVAWISMEEMHREFSTGWPSTPRRMMFRAEGETVHAGPARHIGCYGRRLNNG